MENIDPQQVAASLLVIFLAIGLHEYSHAKFADMAGDPTPRMMGRVTLNLFKHFDPMGSIFIIITTLTGFGIGWGKPVVVNPNKMHNPKWDHFVSVAAGPISNMLQAVVYGIVFRIALPTGALIEASAGGGSMNFFGLFLMFGVIINLSLAVFNLIPFGPLDGHWLVGAFMPDRMRFKWYQFNSRVGSMLLFGLIIFGQFSNTPFLSAIIMPPVRVGFRLITGLNIPL